MKKIFLILCTVLLFLPGLVFAGENYLAGTSSGESITSRGTDNTIVGNYAGRYIKNGRGNTFLGMFAGDVGSGTSGTVKLGYMAGQADSTSHKLFLNTGFYPSYGIFGTFNSGYFGINKTTPTVAWDVTGAGKYSGALTVTGAITGTTASVFSPSLTVRANTAGAGTDSSLSVAFTLGTPVLNFYGSDGDTYLQTITTGDAASWTGATGGYSFDNALSATAITGTSASTISPELDIRANTAGAGADSSLIVTFTDGNPVLTFNASGTGNYAQTVTTGDAASFSGAVGGYLFDAAIDGTDIINTTIGAGGASTGAFTTISASSTSALNAAVTATPSVTVRNNVGGAGADSLLSVSFTTGNPVLTFNASDGDEYTQSINTSDAAVFAGATGGYTFDAVIDGTDVANTTIGAGGASTGAFTTISTSSTTSLNDAVTVAPSLTVKNNVGGAGSDSLLSVSFTTGNPVLTFDASDGDEYTQSINTSDAAVFAGATGGYTFDAVIDGTDIANTTIGAGGASTGAFTTLSTSSGTDLTLQNAETIDNAVNGTVRIYGKMIAVGDTSVFSSEAVVTSTSEADTSSVAFVGGKINIYGTDGDTYSVGINTSDQATFSGAGGGYTFDGAVDTGNLTHLVPIHSIDADSTITTTESGGLYVALPITAKRNYTLPEASAGLNYTFFVADADSIRILSASGDSLITSAGTAWKTTTSVAGTVKLVALDAIRWLMVFSLGTWTSY